MMHSKGGPAPFFLSLCTPRLRDDALLTRAIEAFQAGHHADALIAVEYACRRYPTKYIPAVLRAKILQACRPELHADAWQAAWRCDPELPLLQDLLLQAWLDAGAIAQVAKLGPAFLPARCRSGQHGSLLPLLHQAGLRHIGACWKIGDAIEGMVFAPAAADGAAPRARLLLSDETRQYQYEVPANGSRFRLRCPSPHGVWSVALVTDTDAPQLLPGSPLAFYAEPAMPSPAAPTPPSAPAPARRAISIVVPVYGDFALVQACLNSALASLPRNRSKADIVVVDDASPEPAISAWLDQLAAKGRITLLRNPRNLGFIEAVNRGMRAQPERDVLLLNADTLVHGDWIDRLRSVLYGAPDLASVTPWSNNGEISSFPVIGKMAPAPTPAQLAQIDMAAARTRKAGLCEDVELPTCCGFAMLIRRDVLTHIGMLDGAAMIRGYSEEVDWCLRARAAGYRHLLASGVFVAHTGSVSFGAEKTLRVRQNRKVLDARYPAYSDEYQRFVRNDPLHAARTALATALRASAPAWLAQQPLNANANSNAPQQAPAPALAPLHATTRRIAIWRHAVHDACAAPVLQLARLIASTPQANLRLLVIGEVSEALWHTGVVDALSADEHVRMPLLSDVALLELGGVACVLGRADAQPDTAIPFTELTPHFDAHAWLAGWLAAAVPEQTVTL